MRAFFAVLAAVGLVSCASQVGVAKSDVKGTNAIEYYPLKIGNSWSYDVTFLGQKHTDTIVIDGESEGYFVSKSSSSGAEPVKLMADAYGVRDEKRYLLREPVEAGTTWTNVVSVETVEHYKILSARQPCQVVAGKFSDCVVVESKVRAAQGNLTNQMTFARGVGLVKVATELETNGKVVPQVTLELTAYTLGK
jgi:hypothetical protein